MTMEAEKHLRAVLANLNKHEHWDAGLHQVVRDAEDFLGDEARGDLWRVETLFSIIYPIVCDTEPTVNSDVLARSIADAVLAYLCPPSVEPVKRRESDCQG